MKLPILQLSNKTALLWREHTLYKRDSIFEVSTTGEAQPNQAYVIERGELGFP